MVENKVDKGEVRYGLAFIVVIALVIAIFMPEGVVSTAKLGVLDRIAIMVIAFYFGRADRKGGNDAPK